MKKRQNEIELRIDQDALFVRLDMEALSRRRHDWTENRHCHTEYELHVVLRGVCSADVEDRHYTLREGQAILIPPGHHHNSRAVPGEFDRLSLAFFLPENELAKRIRSHLPACRVFHITSEMERTCRAILDEYSWKTPFWQDTHAPLLTVLMVAVLRQFQLDRDNQGEASRESLPMRTDLIDRYFEEHFSEKVLLSELARALNLSNRQTARVLQESYGMGFQEKLLNTRMDRAAWMLRTTDKSIDEIAGAVGYLSGCSFYHAFRNCFHMTPLQYREQAVLTREDRA